MKKLRKILGLVLIFTFVMCGSIQAFAASYDVTDADSVLEAVNNHTANTGDDHEVILNMQNDINMESQDVNTQEGWSYTFNGENMEIKDLNLTGSGDVTVNGNVGSDAQVGTASTALDVHENVSVTVNGGITSSDTAVNMELNDGESASVTVKNGKIWGGNNGVKANLSNNSSASVTVVEGEIYGGEFGVNAGLNGSSFSVTSDGDIFSDNGSAVNIKADNSDVDVSIDGDIISQREGQPAYTDPALNATLTNSSLDVDVSGKANGGYYVDIEDGYDPAVPGSEVNVQQGGDIETFGKGNENEPCDAVHIESHSICSSTNVSVGGDVNCANPNGGIFAVGDSPYSEINVDVIGDINCGVFSYEKNEYIQTPVNVSKVTKATETVEVPGAAAPVYPLSFETETVSGEKFTDADINSGVLVFFDPADEESIENLAKAQKLKDGGQTVYAVCVSEDYEAAEKLMEEKGLSLEILKNCDGLEAALTVTGMDSAPAALLISGGNIIAASRDLNTLTPPAPSEAGVIVNEIISSTPVELIEREIFIPQE